MSGEGSVNLASPTVFMLKLQTLLMIYPRSPSWLYHYYAITGKLYIRILANVTISIRGMEQVIFVCVSWASSLLIVAKIFHPQKESSLVEWDRTVKFLFMLLTLQAL